MGARDDLTDRLLAANAAQSPLDSGQKQGARGGYESPVTMQADPTPWTGQQSADFERNRSAEQSSRLIAANVAQGGQSFPAQDPKGASPLPGRRSGEGLGFQYNLPGRRVGGSAYTPVRPQQAQGNTGLLNALPNVGDALAYAGDNIQRSGSQLGEWFSGLLPGAQAQPPAAGATPGQPQAPGTIDEGMISGSPESVSADIKRFREQMDGYLAGLNTAQGGRAPGVAFTDMTEGYNPEGTLGSPDDIRNRLAEQPAYREGLGMPPAAGATPGQTATAPPPSSAYDVGYGGIQGMDVPQGQQGEWGSAIYTNIPGGASPEARGQRGIAQMPQAQPSGQVPGGITDAQQQGRGLAASSTDDYLDRERAANQRMKQAQGLSSALNVQSPFAERTAIRNAQVGISGDSQYGDERSRYNVGKGRRSGRPGRAHEDSSAMAREAIRSNMQGDFDQRRAKMVSGMARMAETDRRGVSDRMQQGLGLAELRQGAQDGALDRESAEYRAELGVRPEQPARIFYGQPSTDYDEFGNVIGQKHSYSGITGLPPQGGQSRQGRTASAYMTKMEEAGLKPGSAEYREKIKDMEDFIKSGRLMDDRK